MKIGTRITLLSLSTLLVMTAAVALAGVVFLEGALTRAQERVMRLELQGATQAILQQLDRSGAVAAGREAQAQAERLRGKDGLASGLIFIVDHVDNRVVHHPGLAAGEPMRAPHIDQMFQRGAGTLSYEHGGERRMAVFHTLQPIDWLVGVSVSQGEITAAKFDFMRTIGTVTFVALALSALAFGIFARRLIRRIRVALACVNRIEHGDLGARIELPPLDDELGDLQRGVNAMGERIEQRTQEQQMAQAAQRESEARLRRLVDSSIIGMILWDLAGRVHEANNAFLDIVGYDRADLEAGRINWAELTPAEDAEADRRAAAQIAAEGRCQPYEKRYIRKDGTLVPVLIGGVMLADTADQGVAFVIDLTERKQADADRQARRDAEAASRAKSEFLAIMSHELRTPLNAILGYAQILLRDPQLNGRQQQGLETIHTSGEHLLSLINDLLDLAKIEAGKMELNPGAMAFNALLGTVSAIMRVKADEKQLDFACETDADLPPMVQADEQRLRQVLLNLLSNAIKFTADGSVLLRVNVVGRDADAVRVRFEVSDTGPGMNEQQLARLFQPFEQVGDREHAAIGTGLGLSISQRLVGLMGGRIEVDSAPGEGSRFWFELELQPAAGAAPVLTPARGASGYEGPRRRILVADDFAASRAVLMELLSPLGFIIDEAADGQQALQAAARAWPDLVLMDIKMPVMTGIEAVRTMHRMPRPEGVAMPPVIMLSASGTRIDYVAAQAAGADEVLYKPIDHARLLDRIGERLHLRWTFARVVPVASAPAAPEAGAPQPLPAGELSVLHALARAGNMSRIREHANELARSDPRYAPLAGRLDKLAAGYQSKAILELVESMMSDDVPT